MKKLLGILLMVVLSALAVSRKLEGVELVNSLLTLGFFLLLWFLVGVFLIPLLLRRFRKYINTETLLIVSVGLCFMMAVIATDVGNCAGLIYGEGDDRPRKISLNAIRQRIRNVL